MDLQYGLGDALGVFAGSASRATETRAISAARALRGYEELARDQNLTL
jgi:hypothetical protein